MIVVVRHIFHLVAVTLKYEDECTWNYHPWTKKIATYYCSEHFAIMLKDLETAGKNSNVKPSFTNYLPQLKYFRALIEIEEKQ